MKQRLTSIFRRSGERGIALILTLAIITLVTLILIAFVTSMRVENTASKSFNDVIKARELAQAAVDQAVAQIRQATPLRTENPVSTYATFPGGVSTNYNGLVGNITLYSPSNPAYFGMVPAIQSTNLNNGFWITGSNNVEYTAPVASAMPVGWVYVATNGSLSPPNLSLNPCPLMGRFAYWVDDEAAKININTAFQRPVTSPDPIGYSTNSEVDLNMLLPGLSTFVNAIQARQAPTGPGFTTIEEVKVNAVDPSDADFNTNRFYLTAYSNDANYPNYNDDLDVFDRPRRPLSGAGGVSEAADIINPTLSGAYGRLSDPALAKVYTSGGAFGIKYPVANGADGLKQIIANIIAYQIDPRVTPPPDGGGTPPVYLGLAKTPYINEIQVEYIAVDLGTTPASFSLARNVRVVLFYPYGADLSIYNTPAATEKITVDNLPTWVGSPFSTGPFTFTLPAGSFSGLPSAATAYNRYLVQSDAPVTIPGSLNVRALSSLPTITYTHDYSGNPGRRLDYAQANLTAKAMVGSGNFYQYSVAQDPAVNDLSTEWTPLTVNGSLPATQNSTYPSGHDVTKAIIRTNAMVSVGELGYIHTPTPWTYLRLQPQLLTDKPSIPDWAILDAFTIPGSTPGRININSSVSTLFTASRLVPLKALLNNVVAARDTVAANIYSGTYLNMPDAYGNPVAYDTIGELCEVQGMDNAGSTEALKEAAIQRLANIITVRSSTFTIWVLAQSIKQPPTTPIIGQYNPNFDIITGEVKAQAVVERYENPPGSAPKFRVRYFRYLYN